MDEGEWGVQKRLYNLLARATATLNHQRRYGYYMTPDPPFVLGCFRGEVHTLSKAQVMVALLISLQKSIHAPFGSAANDWTSPRPITPQHLPFTRNTRRTLASTLTMALAPKVGNISLFFLEETIATRDTASYRPVYSLFPLQPACRRCGAMAQPTRRILLRQSSATSTCPRFDGISNSNR